MAVRDTHDLGRLYAHSMAVPRSGPLVELGTSHEVEEPWRVGRCVVLRVWKRALVVGWWGPPRTLAEMLAAEAVEAEMLAREEDRVSTEQIREDFRPEPGHTLLPEGWRVV